jgi:uncharacterized protein YndB with AHSA1/START domain
MSEAEFELSIERMIDAPPETVWRVWTERTEEWFCPKPYRVEILEQDLRPGGRSAMIMRGPEGEEMPMEGVYLEVVPQRRIVSTDAFKAGWVPQTAFMVAITEFEDRGGRTLYRATCRHWSAEARQQHEAMGFHKGWGQVADQLAELAEAEVARAG